MKELSLTVDIMSVIGGGQIDIESIRLNQPLINLLVLKDGRANWDIAKADSAAATTTSEPSKFKVALENPTASKTEPLCTTMLRWDSV